MRLADTDLWLEVEEDRCFGGDEAVFGGGKTIRESMLQGVARRRRAGHRDHERRRARSLGRRQVRRRRSRTAGSPRSGKAGNPDVMDGVDIEIGPTTEIIAGEGRILTAGGIDGHVHFICPQIVDEAVAAGDDDADRRRHRARRGHAGDDLHAVAVGDPRDADRAGPATRSTCCCSARATRCRARACARMAAAGVGGFKLHEDWGSTPAAIDACLRAAEETGVQVAIHTDTLNEAGFVESTLAAIGGRSIHAYHTEGAGGGHAPDIITVASQPNVLPGSTNPTRPHTVNTVDEHLDMLIVCHHLNPRIPEDLAFAESRIRGTTIAAEDILHDLGAISMIGSDSQAMGRVGETIIRTWQTAHVMAAKRGGAERAAEALRRQVHDLPGDRARDRRRGRLGRGRQARRPRALGPGVLRVRPRLVIKGGAIAYAPMGDANASIPTPQPVFMRPMFAGSGARRRGAR